MGSGDPNSPVQKDVRDTGKAAESQKSPGAGDQPLTDVRWIRGERRKPENAQIRRWMDLGDKALQKADEEDDPPISNRSSAKASD